MDTKVEKAVIIGGGVAGLSAGIYLARAGIAPLLFAGSPPGGQLVLTSDVENYPGYEKILGAELVAKMRVQTAKFGTKIIDENVKIIEVSKDGSPHRIHAGGKTYLTRSVIIATGAKALWLGLDSETRLRGKGVSACATCDGFFFRNKTVAVIGGGDTALEEALTLTKFAVKVYLIHRRDSFRGSKIMQKRVFENEKIEVIWNTRVEEITGQAKVEGIKLNSDTGSREIKLDGVFVAIGHKPDTEVFRDIVTVDKKGYIVTASRLGVELVKLQSVTPEADNEFKDMDAKKYDFQYQSSTSAKGIFAAGDCVDYVYRQAATAAGLGVGAALDAERWLESI